MDHAQLMDAMKSRHAVRRYTDQVIPEDVRAELAAAIARGNAESGLNIQAVYDEPEGFRGGMAHYGSFRGVRNYLVLVGQTGTDLDTTCGYYGQRIVLLAQYLGLNSCWVGLTYNKRKIQAEIGEDEKMALVIALGYGENTGKPHKSKPLEDLGRVRGGAAMPDWFRRGTEAASLAPTGLNQQKFLFELDGDAVRATTGSGAYTRVDLGIVKYHFEIGADSPDWHWA